MASMRKLSMNTSLKNANIFDDDAWEEMDGMEIKKEFKKEPDTDNSGKSNAIKFEPFSYTERKIKIELQDNNFENKIKIEPHDSDIKNDALDDTLEEGEIRSSTYKPKKEFGCKTPPPPQIKPDPDEEVDAMFNESPYNKELFNTLKINEQTPIKTEDDESMVTRNTFKSAKRTVFSRVSPYKRMGSDVDCEIRLSARSRLGPEVNDEEERPRKRPRDDRERNPVVLARREKQIEYGKNTIGYDNYINCIPRDERQPDDPGTPNKYQKYSRRAWDALIKQWRLRLHKYDPADTADSTDSS